MAVQSHQQFVKCKFTLETDWLLSEMYIPRDLLRAGAKLVNQVDQPSTPRRQQNDSALKQTQSGGSTTASAANHRVDFSSPELVFRQDTPRVTPKSTSQRTRASNTNLCRGLAFSSIRQAWSSRGGAFLATSIVTGLTATSITTDPQYN